MSKRKLLLADDSVTIQKVVNLTFADEGIEVIAFGDGDSAMEKLAEISPDLVMADVNMPGLNGYQICEQIRQDEVLRHTPVILLVGSFEPFDETEAKRVGADDFLTKPFQSIRQLVNKVTDLLNSKRGDIPLDDRHLADTLEMENPRLEPVTENPQPVQFEDSGLDDEMIQTSQVGSYALDESSKFETREPVVNEADLAKTQLLTNQEIKDFELANAEEKIENETVEDEETYTIDEEIGSIEDFVETENSTETAEIIEESVTEEIAEETTETIEETAENVSEETTEIIEESSETISEQIIEESAETVENISEQPEETAEHITETHEDTIPMPEVASILQIDEANPLELPPIEYDGENDELETETPAVSLSQSPSEHSISPELIEAIAQKVMEKLSDKAVKEVAWEVVPQMTELIVKKMAEEKLKD